MASSAPGESPRCSRFASATAACCNESCPRSARRSGRSSETNYGSEKRTSVLRVLKVRRSLRSSGRLCPKKGASDLPFTSVTSGVLVRVPSGAGEGTRGGRHRVRPVASRVRPSRRARRVPLPRRHVSLVLSSATRRLRRTLAVGPGRDVCLQACGTDRGRRHAETLKTSTSSTAFWAKPPERLTRAAGRVTL